jgi:hypothetical protein
MIKAAVHPNWQYNEDLLYVHDHIIYEHCKISDGSKAR